MRLSNYYIPTLKEAPGDAEVISHKLLVRAGMIRKLTSGIYTFLPLGWKAVKKIAEVIREEMNRAGALEIFMPSVQPADLWKETGRWEIYGKELLRFKDRHDRDYCLGPTHEEVVTDLLRGEIRSYRQLPVNLYQVQTKFRDEIRPRFGLMRCREFIMKDAYSFDKDEEGANRSYQSMYDAYNKAFVRLGLKFRAVEADSGPIGGSYSHEFMVLAETGEDTIAVCNACTYAANLEKAEVIIAREPERHDCQPFEEVHTPGMHTVEQVSDFMGVHARKLVKTLIFDADGKLVAALVRGDRELNEIKLKNLLGVKNLELATAEQVKAVTKAPVGFAGPVGLEVREIFADKELTLENGWITGANKADAHLKNVDLTRDAKITSYSDLRFITEQDTCPKCGQTISLTKGIEVGHVFKLGTKYSDTMKAAYLDENGKERPIIMGCYGIGVTRILAAAIEQNNDKDGIILPPSIAPFEVVLVSVNTDGPAADKALEIYELLTGMGIDILLDDRDERPGIKFKDADLIGVPMRLVIGEKGLKKGIVEARDRRSGLTAELDLNNFADAFSNWREEVRQGWKN